MSKTTEELLLQLKVDIDKVYEAGKKVGNSYEDAYQQGYEEGHAAGQEVGFEEGKEVGNNQYKDLFSQEFIKSITNNGTRTAYTAGAFRYWNMSLFKYIDITFKPKGGCNYTFANTVFDDNTPFPYDNVVLDFSDVIGVTYLFANSNIQHISTLDISNANSAANLFQNCSSLITVDKLIIGDTNTLSFGTTTSNSSFRGCTNLENINIEGCIRKNFNIVEATKLSGNSILSILKALKLENTEINIVLPINAKKYITQNNTAFRQDIYDEYARAINMSGDNSYKYNITFE